MSKSFAAIVSEVAGIGKLMEEQDTEKSHGNAVAGGTVKDIRRISQISK